MKDLFRLDGKVAVVIGGAGGIGQGIAEAMAFYGAEVVIASRKMESLVRAKSEIKEKVGKDVAIYTVDATNEDSIIGGIHRRRIFWSTPRAITRSSACSTSPWM